MSTLPSENDIAKCLSWRIEMWLSSSLGPGYTKPWWECGGATAVSINWGVSNRHVMHIDPQAEPYKSMIELALLKAKLKGLS
jgi:hypothetical protein